VEGKRAAALASGHASIWKHLELPLPDAPSSSSNTWQMPVSGAFPIRVQGSDELFATVV
jgi:hypothetical protein